VRVGDLKAAAASGRTFDVRSFNYDWTTRTAHWTLNEPLGVENVLIEVATANKPVDLHSVGAAPHQMRFSVLPGDVNGDGVTSVHDTVLVRNNSWLPASSQSPTAIYDVNGDGMVNAADWRSSMSLGYRRRPAQEVSSLALSPVTFVSTGSPSPEAPLESVPAENTPPRLTLRATTDRSLRPVAVDRALDNVAPSLSRLRAVRRRMLD
jgi:hypothetical protein